MKTEKSLYRDSKNRKIAGVCAGLADYFKLETWLVRILVVSAFFLLAGPFVLIVYVAAWFILDEKPSDQYADTGEGSGFSASSSSAWRHGFKFNEGNKDKAVTNNDDRKIAVKSKVWQAGEPPRQALADIQERFRVTELKLRKLEGYVTSKEYQINREISQL